MAFLRAQRWLGEAGYRLPRPAEGSEWVVFGQYRNDTGTSPLRRAQFPVCRRPARSIRDVGRR